jgi:hypothetical protein
MTRRKREKTQINKIRNGKVAITISINEIKRIIKEYFANLYLKKKIPGKSTVPRVQNKPWKI